MSIKHLVREKNVDLVPYLAFFLLQFTAKLSHLKADKTVYRNLSKYQIICPDVRKIFSFWVQQ